MTLWPSIKDISKWNTDWILGCIILWVSHTLAAYFSFGFHHPDEHFQIYEFAHSFLGWSDPQHLPWEYQAHIRPWFQPLLHAGIMKAFAAFDAFEPSRVAFFCRLLYGWANVALLIAMGRSFQRRFSLSPLWFLLIASIWFFPYIHVRTSSENLSGIFLGVAFLQLWRSTPSVFAAGVAFGFAFLARYQIALGLAGLALAWLIQDRRIHRLHFQMLLGFLIPVVLGIGLDRWGYGEWVFSAYRYFTVNLVQGVAATYNPYPWYQYLIWIGQLNPVVSLPLFFGALVYSWRRKLDLLTGFVFTFFILHWGLTNKEYRFLFPILNFVPWMMAVSFAKWDHLLKRPAFWVFWIFISLFSFSLSSLRGAAVNMFWPHETYAHYVEPGDVWISNRDFSKSTQVAYYDLSSRLNLRIATSGEQLQQAISDARALETQPPSIKCLIDGRFDDPVTQDLLESAIHSGCSEITTAYPLWIYRYSQTFPWINKVGFKILMECARTR